VRDPHIGATLRQNAGLQTWSARADGATFASRGPQNTWQSRHKLTSCPEIDCLRRRLPPGLLAAAELRAIETNTGADRVLVSQRIISDEHYVRALAASVGARFDSLAHVPRAACPATDAELIEAAKTGVLWIYSGQDRVLVIAPQNIAARTLVNYLRYRTNLSARICLTTAQHLLRFVEKHARPTLVQKAVSELKSIHPEFSARRDRSRLTVLPLIGALATVAALVSAPGVMTTVVDVALALIFLGWTILRAMGIVITASAPRLLSRRSDAIPENRLPVYSVIVALYHEASAVAGLIESLKSLDYPPEKLDIKLVLEPDDHETRHALTQLHLGPTFTIVTAPGEGPRTKPKALNTALPFARGSYVAVFDAEDRPEPDQLKKALQAFHVGGDKLACVQARLTIDNSNETWLTRMFTAEYAGLFDIFLPGIAACRLPLPLGGSSNHFRISTLRQAGAWDPYNVTEDADLGMRLARLGFHTAVIDSTTYEEAPSRFLPWLKQRTRWFKGWMQTWLVHMRHPLRLWRDLGSSGFFVFQLVVGGAVLAAMVHGIFAVALGWQIASGLLWADKSGIGDVVMAGLHAMTLVAGYVISALLSLLGLAYRRKMSCAWAVLFMPVYWLLLSMAAWRALFQLILKPYAWEKTEHRLARRLARGPLQRKSAFTA
jgi:cellulose synthase/poly-beta-1,6-N-acetylglucosamine synthase-like glycosyltransferase